jgi:hypothetical protein
MTEDNSDGEKTLKKVRTPVRSVDDMQAFIFYQILEVFGIYKNNCNSHKVRPTST